MKNEKNLESRHRLSHAPQYQTSHVDMTAFIRYCLAFTIDAGVGRG